MLAVTNTSSKARFVHYKVGGVTKKVWLKGFETFIVDEIDEPSQLVNKQSKNKNELYEKQSAGYSPLRNYFLKERGGFDYNATVETYWKGQIGFRQNAITGEFTEYTFPRLGSTEKTLYIKTVDNPKQLGTKIYLYPHPETLYLQDDLLDYEEYRIYNDGGNTVESLSSTATTQISPSDMGIVINSDDPTSSTLAITYASTWNIPVSNIVTVSLGNSDNLSSTSVLNTARNIISNNMPANVQWLALCFQKPSRVNSDNSITWAITNGYSTISRNIDPLPYNPIFNWPGTRPYDIHGIRPSMLVFTGSVVSNAIAAHGSNPTGTCYMLAANDQTEAPRGNSRISQMQGLNGSTQYISQGIFFNFADNRFGSPGQNPFNNILNKPDMMFYFNGMDVIYGMDTNTIQPGAIGDYVTSTAGYIPTGLGQTPITYLLENGFVGTCGSVIEPWQNALGYTNADGLWVEGSGDLADQFSNIPILVENYLNGRSVIDAYWKSLKQPPRTLILGDPMCAPFCNTGNTNTSGQTQIFVTGCTSPYALNYDPDAFIMGTNCAYPRYFWYMGDVLTNEGYFEHWATGAGFWQPLNISQPTVWKRGSIVTKDIGDGDRDYLIANSYNVNYPSLSSGGTGIQGAIAADFTHFMLLSSATQFQNINNVLSLRNGPSANTLNVVFSDGGSPAIVLSTLTLSQRYDEVKFVFPQRAEITAIVGKNSSSNCANMEFSGLGIIVDLQQAIDNPVELPGGA